MSVTGARQLGAPALDIQRKAIMAGLNLPYPKFVDCAVPGNRQCGVCPEDLPEHLSAYCASVAASPQG